MLDQIGILCSTETGDNEAGERPAGEQDQFRFVKEAGDERRCKEEDEVTNCRYDDVEPENGVVVFITNLFLVDQGYGESTVLQAGSQRSEDGKRAVEFIASTI